ncbi:MAG TPA: DUF4160 domain-containing protein [Thermoanaerobaculia bacterium]|nr:DUF4160 domain-containing protein [Thermoanaerobaculia bacterium]
MPEISRFFGIVVRMYYEEHAPPHFHATYGEQEGVVELQSLSMMAGHLSPRVLGLVVEWASAHRAELEANWERARSGRPLRRVEPLR